MTEDQIEEITVATDLLVAAVEQAGDLTEDVKNGLAAYLTWRIATGCRLQPHLLMALVSSRKRGPLHVAVMGPHLRPATQLHQPARMARVEAQMRADFGEDVFDRPFEEDQPKPEPKPKPKPKPKPPPRQYIPPRGPEEMFEEDFGVSLKDFLSSEPDPPGLDF